MEKINFQAFVLIHSGLTMANVNVLCSVIERYGKEIRLSYRDIGEDLGMTYENVR